MGAPLLLAPQLSRYNALCTGTSAHSRSVDLFQHAAGLEFVLTCSLPLCPPPCPALHTNILITAPLLAQDYYFSVLLLRRVYTNAFGSFGPLFWAGTSIPSGFQEASATNNVTTVLQQDAETQQDIATLTPYSTLLPCDATNSTKCEVCDGGCQPWSVPQKITQIGNEETHYNVPQSVSDVILYRSNNDPFLYGAWRPEMGQNFTIPVALKFPNDEANINSGRLPNGKVYLISNALPNTIRNPIFLTTTVDGYAFNSTAALGDCTSSVFQTPPIQDNGCQYRYPGKSKIGGLMYPQGLAVTAPSELAGFYAVMSANKEDIWVSFTPFSALP
jgi:hypothetical protein